MIAQVPHTQLILWHTNVPAHESRAYPLRTGGCLDARVNGKRGQWTDTLPGFTFDHQRITFNGVGFTNHTNHSVSAIAECMPD